MTALFALENSRSSEQFGRLVLALAEWLRDPEQQPLREAFLTWIRRVVLPSRLPGVVLDATRDLEEVGRMLSQRVEEWTRPWVEKGRQEGLTEAPIELVEERFGPPDQHILDRIAASSREQLLGLIRRCSSARTLDEVFGS